MFSSVIIWKWCFNSPLKWVLTEIGCFTAALDLVRLAGGTCENAANIHIKKRKKKSNLHTDFNKCPFHLLWVFLHSTNIMDEPLLHVHEESAPSWNKGCIQLRFSPALDRIHYAVCRRGGEGEGGEGMYTRMERQEEAQTPRSINKLRCEWELPTQGVRGRRKLLGTVLVRWRFCMSTHQCACTVLRAGAMHAAVTV